MSTLLKVFTAVVIVIAINRAVNFLSFLDIFKSVHYHAPGPCHLVPDEDQGSEDMEFIDDGVALITSGLRFPPGEADDIAHFQGRILKFDFNKPEEGTTEVKIENVANTNWLNPHGISIWKDPGTGETLVYIVNHPADKDYVEIFSYNKKSNTLKHIQSITHPDFGLLNDVVGLGPDSFYVTQYHYFSRKLGKFEMPLGLRWGSLFYYNKGDCKPVATDFLMPNGVILSPDKKMLYLATGSDRSVNVYKRNLQDNTLQLEREVKLYTYGDNINVDAETGDLWIGAHPVAYQALKHLKDFRHPSPSQVLRIIPSENYLVEEVYSDPGTLLYGSTVALRYKDAMLVGTVKHKLLYCKLIHIHGK